MSNTSHPRIVWHGLTRGEPDVVFGVGRKEVFLAHDRSLAELYAGDSSDSSPTILEVEDLSVNPLVLATGEDYRDAWLTSGADKCEGRFHPDVTAVFAQWARLRGHDAIVVPASAFECEIGYTWAAGTIGDPQTIILDPTKIRVVSVDPPRAARYGR